MEHEPTCLTPRQSWRRGITRGVPCRNCTVNIQRIWGIQDMLCVFSLPFLPFCFLLALRPWHQNHSWITSFRIGSQVCRGHWCADMVADSGTAAFQRGKDSYIHFSTQSLWEQNVSEACTRENQQHGDLSSPKKHGINKFIKTRAEVLAVHTWAQSLNPTVEGKTLTPSSSMSVPEHISLWAHRHTQH